MFTILDILAGERSPIVLMLEQIASEVLRAQAKHKPLNSAHEAYAVILEELDEFKAEVWKQTE